MSKAIYLARSPKRRTALVDGVTLLARDLTRLIAIVTLYERLGRAATLGNVPTATSQNLLHIFANAKILDIPVSHLLVESPLVYLVGGPAHVENVRLVLSTYHVFHKVFSAVVVESTRKIQAKLRVSLKHLHFQALGTGLFRQEICSSGKGTGVSKTWSSQTFVAVSYRKVPCRRSYH